MSRKSQTIKNIRYGWTTNKPDAYDHYNAIITRWFYRVMAAAMMAGAVKVVVGLLQINGVIS